MTTRADYTYEQLREQWPCSRAPWTASSGRSVVTASSASERGRGRVGASGGTLARAASSRPRRSAAMISLLARNATRLVAWSLGVVAAAIAASAVGVVLGQALVLCSGAP